MVRAPISRTLFYSINKLSCFSSSSCFYSSCTSQTQRESERDADSIIYRHKVQLQRPNTIKWQNHLFNSVNFIGSIALPLKITRSTKRFGIHTILQLKSSPLSSDPSVRILLHMWDHIAEMSSKHVKQNDMVYVSGCLGSYKKVGPNGKPSISYKVTVEELNFVACNGGFQTCTKNTEALRASMPTSCTQCARELEKETDPIYLWQLFFANPYEWWDNRKKKLNPRAPDFKHKDTGECLWLNPKNPPWVRRQLQLLDSKMTELGYPEPENSRSRVSVCKFENYEID